MPTAEQDKGGQHRGRLVEDIAPAGERDHQRIGPAGADGDCDQDHHVERPGSQGSHGTVKEDPGGVADDGQTQEELPDIVTKAEWSRQREVPKPDGRSATIARSVQRGWPPPESGCAFRAPWRPSTCRRDRHGP